MGLTLKPLQCTKFLNLHTLVIGANLLKELGDKVKSRKNPCPITPKSGKTHTSPYDSG